MILVSWVETNVLVTVVTTVMGRKIHSECKDIFMGSAGVFIHSSVDSKASTGLITPVIVFLWNESTNVQTLCLMLGNYCNSQGVTRPSPAFKGKRK